MGLEIERKFLVTGDFLPFVTRKKRIVQGYICSSPNKTVRIRISGEEAFITIKGMVNKTGMSRYEFEQPIPLLDGEQLIELCDERIIEKIRYYIPMNEYMWEVDVFDGEDKGLIIAEIELPSEQSEFDKPVWLGKEVTGDARYYNSMLSKHPYSTWKEIK